MKTRSGLISIVLACVCLSGCKESAKQLWSDVIQKCAVNDLLGPKVLYFGPSNNLGPGTIFQAFVSGGTQESHLFQIYAAGHEALVHEGNLAKCGGNVQASTSLDASFSLGSALPVSGSAALSLQRAKTITLKPAEFRWDDIITGDFDTFIGGLADDNAIKRDLLLNHQLVLSRALRVTAVEADFDFSSNVAPEIKAQLPAGAVVGPLAFKADWKSETKLTLSSATPFYIAGELRPYGATGLAAGGRPSLGAPLSDLDKKSYIPK